MEQGSHEESDPRARSIPRALHEPTHAGEPGADAGGGRAGRRVTGNGHAGRSRFQEEGRASGLPRGTGARSEKRDPPGSRLRLASRGHRLMVLERRIRAASSSLSGNPDTPLPRIARTGASRSLSGTRTPRSLHSRTRPSRQTLSETETPRISRHPLSVPPTRTVPVLRSCSSDSVRRAACCAGLRGHHGRSMPSRIRGTRSSGRARPRRFRRRRT